MKYIVSNGNTATIHNLSQICRVGDPVPWGDRWKIVGQYVTDFFSEKLYNIIDEELYDFQTENDILDGGLPPELEAELTNRMEALKDTIAECKIWQLVNNK